MSVIISVDGGTTNTRFTVTENGCVKSSKKISIGIRNTLTEEGRRGFISEISNALSRICENEGKSAEAVVFSGMIGSETGLYTCAHVCAPISVSSLAQKITKVDLEGICPLPAYFIPGVKTAKDESGEFDVDALSTADIMRGEEAEIVGIYTKLGISTEALIALPGSHMKYVRTDGKGGIISFFTSISGELIRAIAENTILKSSLDGAYPNHPKKKLLTMGYEYATAHGITEAAFKVRILDRLCRYTKEELYSFLLGVILHEDIRSITDNDLPRYVGGSGLFKEALTTLLCAKFPQRQIYEIPANISDNAAAFGAEQLYKMSIL